MGTMSISFRIADATINGKDYSDRYQALTNEIKAMVRGKYWEQTTAFLLIQTEQTIDQVAARCRRVIATSEDLVLIQDAEYRSARLIGRNDDADIHLILPYLK